MAEQYLPTKAENRLRNLCIECEQGNQFSFSSQLGDSTNTGKNLLAIGSSSDAINTSTIETINLISQNTETQVINGDLGQFFSLEVVEIRGFRAVGDMDFNGSNMVNLNIDSGTIDNTIIGGEVPADGTFEDLKATQTVTFQGVSGDVCVFWDYIKEIFNVCGAISVTGQMIFGNTGTHMFGDSMDLFMNVADCYIQDIQGCHELKLGSTQSIAIGGDQLIGISSNQTVTVGGNVGTTIGGSEYHQVEESLEIDTGATYSVESHGDLSLTSNDDLNLHADGCLNITADCLNMTIGTTSKFLYGSDVITDIVGNNTLGITGNNTEIIRGDQMVTVVGNDSTTVLGHQNLSISGDRTTLIQSDDILGISGDLMTDIGGSVEYVVGGGETKQITEDFQLDVGTTMSLESYGETSIVSHENMYLHADCCYYLTTGKCMDVNIGSTSGFLYGGDQMVTIEGNQTTDIEGTQTVGISGDLNSIIFGSETKQITEEYDIDIGSTLSMESSGQMSLVSNEDLNLHAAGCVNITGSCLNLDISTTAAINYGDDLTTNIGGNQVTNIDGDNSLSVTGNQLTILLGDETKQITGQYDIDVGTTLSMEAAGQVTVNAGENLDLTAMDCLTLNANSIKLNYGTTMVFNGDTLDINVNNTNITGDTLNLAVTNVTIGGNISFTDAIDLPPSTEQQWIKYNDFEASGTTGAVYVDAKRTIGVSGAGEYYWDFCNNTAEPFYVVYDISQNVRDQANKGYKLQRIYPYYKVLNESLTSTDVNVIKHSLDNFNPTTGRTGIPLGTSVGNFSLALGVTNHYPEIGVTADFLKGHESIMVEICFNKKQMTDVHFYGMTIEFEKII